MESTLYNVNYTVNLVHGEIKAVYAPKKDFEAQPKSWFTNQYQAEYCSLGIMLQNMAEETFKREKEVNECARIVLGTSITYTAEFCKEERQRLRADYAQYWI